MEATQRETEYKCEGEGLRRNGEVTGTRGKWRITSTQGQQSSGGRGRGEEKRQLFCVNKEYLQE